MDSKKIVYSDDNKEDDYMSDKFIAETLSSKSSSLTSLLYSHKQRYEHERYKRKLESQQKSKHAMKEMEEEKRQIGLAKPLLDPKNKGFQLLQKMMSKSSATLLASEKTTKMESNSNTFTNIEQLISERRPIEIELKTGREGIGHHSKRLKSTITKLSSDKKNKEIDLDKFLKYRIEKSELHWLKKDYFELQKICYNLDSSNQSDPSEPLEEWYWPKKFVENLKNKKQNDKDEFLSGSDQENDIDDEEIDYKSRLDQLENYIRSKYFYCLWCGCHFESKDDLEKHCPGNTRQLH